MFKPIAMFVASSLCCSIGLAAQAPEREAQVETLSVGTPLPRFFLLSPSTRLYVRYRIVGDARETQDIWRRQISYETYEGKRALHIVWRWDSVTDQKFTRIEDFWFEPETFRDRSQ